MKKMNYQDRYSDKCKSNGGNSKRVECCDPS